MACSGHSQLAEQLFMIYSCLTLVLAAAPVTSPIICNQLVFMLFFSSHLPSQWQIRETN